MNTTAGTTAEKCDFERGIVHGSQVYEFRGDLSKESLGVPGFKVQSQSLVR